MNHEAWLGSPPRASEERGLWPLRANKIYHQDYRTSRRRPSIFLTVYIGLVRYIAANSFRPMNSFEPCKDYANTFKGITNIVVWRGSHESPGHCGTNRPYLFKFCRTKQNVWCCRCPSHRCIQPTPRSDAQNVRLFLGRFVLSFKSSRQASEATTPV